MLKFAKTKQNSGYRKWLYCSILLLAGHLITAQPNIPKFPTLQIVSSSSPPPPAESGPQYLNNPLVATDRYTEQNRKMLQQAGLLPGPSINMQRSSVEIRNALADNGSDENRVFETIFQQFLRLNPDSFSITKAVYLSESGYYDDPPSFEKFESAIKQGTKIVKQILKNDGLSEKNDLSDNYAIQKLYTQDNMYVDSATGKTYPINRLRYDHDDFMGEKDWSKMFVNKLLYSGTGQCHSLPLLYLCIAEQLHAKAYLSLAPNHSFIQYVDNHGNRYNFETTNGNLVSQAWLAGSTFVTAAAIKAKTYLDTLSSKRLFAQCLGDFLLTYLMKVKHYDDFSSQIMNKILALDSANITALMEQANFRYLVFQRELKLAENPQKDAFNKFPNLSYAYERYESAREQIGRTGFQEMPKIVYEAWLNSLESEKQKENNRLEQQRMEEQIKRLKQLHSKFTKASKN